MCIEDHKARVPWVWGKFTLDPDSQEKAMMTCRLQPLHSGLREFQRAYFAYRAEYVVGEGDDFFHLVLCLSNAAWEIVARHKNPWEESDALQELANAALSTYSLVTETEIETVQQIQFAWAMMVWQEIEE